MTILLIIILYTGVVVTRRKERDGTQSYLVKWDELDYDQCTWEQERDIKDLPYFQQKLELFRQFNDPANMQAAEKKLNADQAQQKAFKKYKQQSTCLAGTPMPILSLSLVHTFWPPHDDVMAIIIIITGIDAPQNQEVSCTTTSSKV